MIRVLSIIAGLVAVALVALPAHGQDPASQVGTGKGWFHADCPFSHRAQVDPIVNPGTASGHMHDFHGATSLTARSVNTFARQYNIRHGETTCERDTSFRDLDRSAYWVPTAYQDGEPVQSATVTAGYSAGVRDVSRIRPFPDDLKVIAGRATGPNPQEINGQRVYLWICPGGTAERGTATVAPTCSTERLDLIVKFPDCWDGINSDSLNHQAHMAYSRQIEPAARDTDGDGAADLPSNYRVCGGSHPVLVPQLQVTFRYPTFGGPGFRLSSGNISTAHADFMNGWEPNTLALLIGRCHNADMYCGGGDVPDPNH